MAMQHGRFVTKKQDGKCALSWLYIALSFRGSIHLDEDQFIVNYSSTVLFFKIWIIEIFIMGKDLGFLSSSITFLRLRILSKSSWNLLL